MNIESIAVGVEIPCDCNNGRIVRIASQGRDYLVWCQCSIRYFVTVTGKVFKSRVHHEKVH